MFRVHWIAALDETASFFQRGNLSQVNQLEINRESYLHSSVASTHGSIPHMCMYPCSHQKAPNTHVYALIISLTMEALILEPNMGNAMK